MTWIQRLPHSDPRLEEGRANFAALLYLFKDPNMGGTGFYQWRDVDFWQRMTTAQQDNPEAGLDELRERFETRTLVVPRADGLEAEGAPHFWAAGFQSGDTTVVQFSVGTIEGLGRTLEGSEASAPIGMDLHAIQMR